MKVCNTGESVLLKTYTFMYSCCSVGNIAVLLRVDMKAKASPEHFAHILPLLELLEFCLTSLLDALYFNCILQHSRGPDQGRGR